MKTLPVLIVLLLYAGGNFYVFLRLWQVLPWHAPVTRWIVIAGGIFLSTAMILSFVLSGLLSTRLVGLLHVVGTTWIFVFLYLLMATLARDLFLWIDGRVHLLPFPSRERVTYLVALLAVIAVLVGGHICYLHKRRVELTIDTGKLAGREITLLLVSDLHLGHGIGNRELARWIEQINSERPDVVLVAGDVIDSDLRPLEERRAWEVLRRIDARCGVFACPGNHEYIAGIDRS
ncbi:MAG: metallophosphoesterase, partial [Odoribacteraceae bacterium]|nr:metallophosphoesterase [Odoribacteraceae bacterium]